MFMEDEKSPVRVGNVVNTIVAHLEDSEKDGATKALLAGMRGSIGKPFTASMNVWAKIFADIPRSFLSKNGEPTYQENAIFYTLQIYALAKQGSASNVVADPSCKDNFGRSLAEGRSSENESLDKRFNIMVTSSDFETFTYRLRHLFRIVKSKAEMTVNYGRLADDLFFYQIGDKEKICFYWAEGYYSYIPQDSKEKEKET